MMVSPAADRVLRVLASVVIATLIFAVIFIWFVERRPPTPLVLLLCGITVATGWLSVSPPNER